MLYKFNTVESKFIFSNPTVTTLDNTIFDAGDTATSSDTLTAYCPSSTVTDDFSERRYITADATSTTLDVSQRFCFGSFLSDSAEVPFQNSLFACKGYLHWMVTSTDQVVAYPIFGRSNSATITAGVTTLSDWTPILVVNGQLPVTNTVNYHQTYSCNVDILKYGIDTNAYPLFFGWMIQNNSSTVAARIGWLQASVNFQKYNFNAPINTPSGV